jgi:AraC-like DNA-binding protein
MKSARGIDEFVGDPVGRYDLGATHLVWCHSPTLVGTVHWGRPDASHARELTRRLEVTRHPALAGGFDGYMDARGMEAFDWPAFGVLSDYVREQLADWRRKIRRHAIVVPHGIVGAVVAGLLPLLGPDYPLRFFSSVESAVEWFGRPELLSALDELAPIVDEAQGVTPLVRTLRGQLARSLDEPTLVAVARTLGMTTRTLQRDLRRDGTSFSNELTAARVRAARTMLETTDEKVEVIARRVGCASSSQLSLIFRRNVGETPAQYRVRRRGV